MKNYQKICVLLIAATGLLTSLQTLPEKPENKPGLVKRISQEINESSKIMATCIAAALLYGIAQDQITYRYCPEYFTKHFHAAMMENWKGLPIFDSLKKLFDNNPNNPTLRATIWGVVASWWMGAIIGVPVTLACRLGSWPKLNYQQIIQPMTCALALTGVSTAYAGYQAAQKPSPYIFQGVNDSERFYHDLQAHRAAYAFGPLWSLGLIVYILKARYNLSKKAQADVQIADILDDKAIPEPQQN